MRTAAEMRAEVARRAAEDPGFREALKASPKETIGALVGVRLPDGLRVHVHEESGRTAGARDTWCCPRRHGSTRRRWGRCPRDSARRRSR